MENLTSWLEFAEPNVPEDPVGRWYTTSRFFFEEEIQPGEVRQDLIRTLLSMREYEAVMTCHLISFGGILTIFIQILSATSVIVYCGYLS